VIRAVVLAALLLVLAGAAVALPERADRRPPRLALARVTSPLVHSNSRDGQAILVANGMLPGQRRSGEVTIRNHGGGGEIALATTARGPLAERLRLTVTDGGDAVIDTPLDAALACVPLGHLGGGEARTYRFTATFDRGVNDNVYAGASARADFEWRDGCDGDGRDAEPPAPAPLPADTPALALGDTRVALDPGPYRFAARTGTTRIGARCVSSTATTCVGTLELERRQPHGGRGIAMAKARFRIPAGKRRTITLKLNARARRLIARKGSVPVLARVGRAVYLGTLLSSRRKATSSM
jgi:spore coat-associated protein N